jgi:hypothetical protein
MKSILRDQSGVITIVTLVIISFVFMIMMATAGYKLIEASKKAVQMNEAYNYLLVSEEIGQAVSRARSLGRHLIDCRAPIPAAPDGCPAGTVRQTWNNTSTFCYRNDPNLNPPFTTLFVPQYTLCIPDRDGDGTAEASDFCVDINGYNYCLTDSFGILGGLARYDLADDVNLLNWSYPLPYVETPGAPSQSTPGGVDLPRNNNEIWAPTTVGWGAANNQIFTTNCTPDTDKTKYWLGCHWCDDPRVECWRLIMCRPSATGAPVACTAAEAAQQTVLFYFENDRRN